MTTHLHAFRAVIDGEIKNDVCIKAIQSVISEISYGCSESPKSKYSGTLIPGFVDIHAHGGGGSYFSNPNLDRVHTARERHRSHGTTSMLASLVTEPIGVLEEQIRRLVPLVEDGIFAGIHLEGPYLAHARCGAHQPSLLRVPTIEELTSLLDSGMGNISMITLAPELEGGITAIEYLVSRGVKVALGHSEANSTTTRDALSAGATLITHFSNGMPKPSEKTGTITSESLSHRNLPLEMILDKAHVSDETLSLVKDSGDNRIILITDAMSAAGEPDGHYTIGALGVTVKDGIARLDSNGSLAGSTLTMDQAFKNYFNSGASLIECVYAASTLPAKTIGLSDVGEIAIGKKVQLLEISSELEFRSI